MSPDAPTNPSLYWLGSFSEAKGTFDVDKAKGPYRLDLGDVLYAPNIMKDEVRRTITCCAGSALGCSVETFALLSYGCSEVVIR